MVSEINASDASGEIVLVPATADIVRAGRAARHATLPVAFTHAPAFDSERLAPGDGIDVTVWERDGLAVFPAGQNGASDLGEMIVDRAGDIYFPYAGRIRAEGLTVAQMRDAIMRRLSRLMTASDVVVRPTTRRGQTVTVQGDLQKPGVYPLGRDMSRLSDLLSLAAPSQVNPEQLAISVRRQGTEATIRLADVYRHSANDIPLRAGDSIVAHNVVEQVVVLGAAGVQGRVKVPKRDYTLLDALGDSRGLNDALANPRGVYLLRQAETSERERRDARPVVYQFDFTRPEQIALAGQFVVHDGDAVLVSDAPFTQVQKLLSTFSASLGTARSVSALAD
ncbi:polysaccharide biosynthesis/export family protein [Burkholderia sp. 8Y]|uniref:polysaccharide biosynthesis/export family protein n=1 Tax=Burkholderia sp. 8Y TaxID=2653133 RepID=UPI0013583624|nr:polysaccharide biosynthesis/export family protein [Burkholderia sp. 8Y]